MFVYGYHCVSNVAFQSIFYTFIHIYINISHRFEYAFNFCGSDMLYICFLHFLFDFICK